MAEVGKQIYFTVRGWRPRQPPNARLFRNRSDVIHITMWIGEPACLNAFKSRRDANHLQNKENQVNPVQTIVAMKYRRN
jgi:hypothetical protein